MRVYLPATFAMLVELNETGRVAARSGWAFAVTPSLREFYTGGDEEELEAVAFDDAAEASIRLLAIGDEQFPHRRVVISADVDDSVAKPDPDMVESVVKLIPPEITIDAVAALHVDVAEAEEATATAIANIDAADLGDEDAELAVGDAQDNYLAFYDPSELPFLVDLL